MNNQKPISGRNSALDGVRALSAVGIILMHVLVNGSYKIPGFIGESMIPSFTDLVFLFMIVSGYVMCCGYYEKILNNQVPVGEFYGKRIKKIWPFFAFLSVVDLVLSPSKNALYEVFANLTLVFGFLPKTDIEVIGVGWFIGLVFVFYLTFPFYCYLLSSKKKAWISFAVALVFNYLCQVRFDAQRTNIIYSGVFFLAGGLLYLYKDQLEMVAKKYKWAVFLAIVAASCAYYLLTRAVPVKLVLFSLMVIYTMDPQGRYWVLSNPVSRFLGDISLEMYLCHMVVFRLMDKCKLLYLFYSDTMSFVMASVGTILGTIALSVAAKWLLKMVEEWLRHLAERSKKIKE